MLALQQEVYITKNHKLTITVPDYIPIGKNKLSISFEALDEKDRKNKNKILFESSGILKNKMIDPLEWQKKIRDEYER